jgi:hypothetical protein
MRKISGHAQNEIFSLGIMQLKEQGRLAGREFLVLT